MHKAILSLLIFLAGTSSIYATNKLEINRYMNYLDKYNKTYENHELLYRFNIYSKNMQMIEQHNFEYDQGLHTYTLDEGPFTDLTNQEFRQRHMGYGINELSNVHRNCTIFNTTYTDTPSSVDWRERGAVTPIKDQGQCGSCWSFSASGAVEGLYQITNGNLVSFSEQQLVDCSGDFGNMGCSGGWMTNAFEYFETVAICSELEYPYEGIDESCHPCDKPVANSQLSSCGYFSQYPGHVNETDADNHTVPQNVIYQLSHQPISVAIAADAASFQHYSSGVYNDEQCYQGYLDHGVLLVAYNETTLTIKNSWGTSWGDHGYITIARNSKTNPVAGICGVYVAAAYPSY